MTTRELWSTPDRADIAKQLAEADRASFDDRVARVKELYAEFGPPADMLLFGGIEALYALQEMQNCYVTANSMAVVSRQRDKLREELTLAKIEQPHRSGRRTRRTGHPGVRRTHSAARLRPPGAGLARLRAAAAAAVLS